MSALLLGWAILLVADIPNSVFEIDGNAKVDAVGGLDWALLNGDGATKGADGQVGLPGYSLVRTFVTGGPEIFTQGGSKDPIDIPRWDWKAGSVPDKDSLTTGIRPLTLMQTNT